MKQFRMKESLSHNTVLNDMPFIVGGIVNSNPHYPHQKTTKHFKGIKLSYAIKIFRFLTNLLLTTNPAQNQ
ncbi:MAG: hypothetical protein IPN79_14050 [Saprospiraceae bacterium]|nr:hypothetical protein [Saprospiraceae bacterium]